MSRQYSYDQPLHPIPSSPHQQFQSTSQPPLPPYQSPPQSPLNPSAHPDTSFGRLRGERRHSRGQIQPLVGYEPESFQSSSSPPPPPPHRDNEGRIWGRELGYTPQTTYENITPGADNFGERASGGLAGVAMSVADANARESGLEAMRNIPGYDPRREESSSSSQYGPPPPAHQAYYEESQFNRHSPAPQPYADSPYRGESYEDSPYTRPVARQDVSQSSLTPLGAAAFPPGMATPQARSTTSRSPHSFNNDPYADNLNPYRHSRNLDPSFGAGIDPTMIADDGDDGLDYRQQNQGSLLSLAHNSDRNVNVAAGGAAAGGVLGSLGGLVGRSNGAQQYDPVHPYAGSGGSGTGPEYDLGQEKSGWLRKSDGDKKRNRIIAIVIVGILVLGGIAGGIAGGLLSSQGKKGPSETSGLSAAADKSTNGDLNINSAEIKKLMNNKNLHKVFPGIDYTPMYTQYPECTKYGASQNNVTRDLAILSQLTNTIRLYGTDCNATQLLIHSIDQLELKGKVKIWLGVWQDKNNETNARQLKTMYDIFDKYGAEYFTGIIIGNEVLFRKDFTVAELGVLISGVKSNLTARGISLPVASSDLGDDWTPALADEVDVVMANIHPFFAGISSKDAAAWTWRFWQDHNVILKPDKSKHIISETGWPSTGGKACGGAATCEVGSVAGISEMNDFLEGWVCPALTNGTNYFLFEAFDEPWKIKFNEAGKEWEDKWGIMDVNRNLKPGVVIPDCGGKTID